jgi:L-amino acid N-acyltransferase YncA
VLRWLSHPDDVTSGLLDALVVCWTRVSNAGGAVGFPHLPVDRAAVRQAAADLQKGLRHHQQLLVAEVDGALAGWLLLQMNGSSLTAHWGVVRHVQTDLPFRGAGLGRMLMAEVARSARELGLEQLHIAVRGGQGIEDFYTGLGWQTIGRWPAALRLRPGDDRDEILMLLALPVR